ncbi:MAG: 4Fe-4S dicluster domain-containing protein [Chlorobiaceae bacterium]|nr:4Fe-4S dicluster domain-containing protein [Chlorobiaceae bacterium]
MLDFEISITACTRCGECVADCPARIINMKGDGYPFIPVEKEINCYKCQHCFTVCPTGALSIHGLNPSGSRSLETGYPEPDKLELLMKGRRSVRRYIDENLDPALLQKLLEVAWHAPTGVNSRQVLFTVLDSREKVARFREEVMSGLARVVRENALPKGREFYANFLKLWEEKQVDILFRKAPHLLVASAPETVATPAQDCLIALSYFELFAQANGVGTLWNGLAKWAIDGLLPETRKSLGIPASHQIGYVMVFGKPDVHYVRTVQHAPALINRSFQE